MCLAGVANSWPQAQANVLFAPHGVWANLKPFCLKLRKFHFKKKTNQILISGPSLPFSQHTADQRLPCVRGAQSPPPTHPFPTALPAQLLQAAEFATPGLK